MQTNKKRLYFALALLLVFAGVLSFTLSQSNWLQGKFTMGGGSKPGDGPTSAEIEIAAGASAEEAAALAEEAAATALQAEEDALQAIVVIRGKAETDPAAVAALVESMTDIVASAKSANAEASANAKLAQTRADSMAEKYANKKATYDDANSYYLTWVGTLAEEKVLYDEALEDIANAGEDAINKQAEIDKKEKKITEKEDEIATLETLMGTTTMGSMSYMTWSAQKTTAEGELAELEKDLKKLEDELAAIQVIQAEAQHRFDLASDNVDAAEIVVDSATEALAAAEDEMNEAEALKDSTAGYASEAAESASAAATSLAIVEEAAAEAATYGDSDDDGLTDAEEVDGSTGYITDPGTADTDMDGILDGEEVNGLNGYTSNPNVPNTDTDLLEDGEEMKEGSDGYITDPMVADTDGGGTDDDEESLVDGTDPTDASDDLSDGSGDSEELDPFADDDGDGLVNTKEESIGTDPLKPDTDDDDLSDYEEQCSCDDGYETEPTIADTDGGGVDDGVEVLTDETDPTDASDDLVVEEEEPEAETDTDADGTPDSSDSDDDDDGVADSSDAFPLDKTETLDTDSDGTGNTADSDDDGDGVSDSLDAFPLDSTETADTDGDGIGDNDDSDDSDDEEEDDEEDEEDDKTNDTDDEEEADDDVPTLTRDIILSNDYTCTDSFTDNDDEWHEDIVCRAQEAGWVKGYTSTVFGPDGDITRAEYIKVLTKIFGLDEEDGYDGKTGFNDVSVNDWFYPYINLAEGEDWIRTRDAGEQFNPNTPITRADAILWAIRAADQSTYQYDVEKTFSDVKNNDYFAYALAIAIETEVDTADESDQPIVEGYSDGTFGPYKKIARSEAMAIITRAAIAWGVASEDWAD